MFVVFVFFELFKGPIVACMRITALPSISPTTVNFWRITLQLCIGKLRMPGT